jgi:hypothetical protein
VLNLQRLTRLTSACFRSRAPGPVSGQLYGKHPAGGPVQRSRFPAAFRPPAFASWASCSRQGIGLSLRSACQQRPGWRHWTRTGFPRSTRMRCGRAGCPLYPRGDGVPCGHRCVRGRRLPPHSGWPLPPRYCTPARDVRLTRHQQGFRVIHPSGLPLTCSTRPERAPLGFPLSFAPSRYQPRTSGRGRVWNTNPKSRLRRHAEPPIDELTHSVRPRVAPH